MNKYLAQLSEHLASQPVEFHDWDADSILSFLYCCYAEDHPLENEKIRGCYEKLEPAFEGLPREISNQLFRNIADLCTNMSLLHLSKVCISVSRWNESFKLNNSPPYL